jgi:protein-S-isoprenylcysteine O-methyltransferase Ste14
MRHDISTRLVHIAGSGIRSTSPQSSLWPAAVPFAATVYVGAMAIFFHLFVIGYEEPTLYRRFGTLHDDYRQAVPRWIPRRRQKRYC